MSRINLTNKQLWLLRALRPRGHNWFWFELDFLGGVIAMQSVTPSEMRQLDELIAPHKRRNWPTRTRP